MYIINTFFSGFRRAPGLSHQVFGSLGKPHPNCKSGNQENICTKVRLANGAGRGAAGGRGERGHVKYLFRLSCMNESESLSSSVFTVSRNYIL